jgi:Leucine-rich repeat (LRR) protein
LLVCLLGSAAAQYEDPYSNDGYQGGDDNGGILNNGGFIPNQPTLSQAEVQALVRIYHATGGEHWLDNTGWLQGNPCGDGMYVGWHGVSCGILGLQLVLPNNNMTGEMPWDAVCALESLSVVHLSNNSLTGSLPDCLANTTTFDFDVSINLFSGRIPESICDLTRLQFFHASRNNLIGEIPGCFGRLLALQELNIEFNGLTGVIPPTLCNLVSFTTLALNFNRLQGSIPSCIHNLNTSLTGFFATGNRLEGPIPSSLCNLLQLIDFEVSDNLLTGSIPDCLGQLQSLQTFSVSENRLTGVIPFDALCQLNSSITYLILGNNNFAPGPIPQCLCSTWAEVIDVSSTRRTGTIPGCLFGNSTPGVTTSQALSWRLGNFSASHNMLVGEIPRAVCRATALKVLDLSHNEISGSIPDCIGGAVSLNSLLLDALPLTGLLPPGLFSLPGLQYIAASGASFTGGLPPTIDFSMTSNYTIYTIDGVRLPESGHALEHLELLAFVDCDLSGPLPAWLGSTALRSLKTVALGGNRFSGPLPDFAAGGALEQLAAPNNDLSGDLSPLRNATKLRLLDLSSNRIGGTVPQWLASRTSQMTLLAVTNNHLSCDLPTNTTIAPGGELRLLDNNLFSNQKLPDGVATADPSAHSYIGGSDQLTTSGSVFAVVLFASLVVLLVFRFLTGRSSAPPSGGSSSGCTSTHLQVIYIGMAIAVVAVGSAVVLIPVYVSSPSMIECRDGWSVTVAFLQPGDFNSTLENRWTIVSAVVGAFFLGGITLTVLLVIGHRDQLVATGRDARRSVTGATTARVGGVMSAVIALVATCTLVAILVGINVSFVLLQESSELEGRTKTFVVAAFAVIHDVINLVICPVAVAALAGVLKTSEPMYVLLIATSVALCNSLLAPMIGLLLSSDGCFHNKFFGSNPSVSSSVNVPSCIGLGLDSSGQCVVLANYTLVTSYTEPFEFSGERCLSSIVVLYTPEYLFIFAIRVMMFPVAWWLARVGKPWLLAGTRVRNLNDKFSAAMARLLRVRRNQPASADGDASAQAARRASEPALQALAVLHSMEPVIQTLNLLSIAMCFGMLSPLVAVGALAVFVNLWSLSAALGEPNSQGADDSKATATVDDDVTSDMYGGSENGSNTITAPAPSHRFPAVCFACLLVVHSVYTAVLMSVGGTAPIGWVVVAANWLIFGGAWLWRTRVEGDNRTISGSPHRGVIMNAVFSSEDVPVIGGVAGDLMKPLLLDA